MILRLCHLDGRETVVDLPIGFQTNGKRLSNRNPWPVDYIGSSRIAVDGSIVDEYVGGRWQIVGEERDGERNRLIVRQVAP